ncbi:MAG TPA: hypothetical protein VN452_04615 [Longilinea sp.]|nr:hypothetical protein [Longilinea sp.]
MPMHSMLTERSFLKTAQVFNWATKRHFTGWYFGEWLDRQRRIEILLKRLSEKGKLKVTPFGKKLVYIVPRYRKLENHQILHGLGVTEGLVRFVVSDRSAQIIPERWFKTKVRPEWGLVIGNKTLLYEYCTKDNAQRFNVLKYKIHAYQNFISENQVVLFVMHISREEVKEKIKQLKPEGPFMFTDLTTFMSVPLGDQLTAKIYLWEDGHEYQLRPD